MCPVQAPFTVAFERHLLPYILVPVLVEPTRRCSAFFMPSSTEDPPTFPPQESSRRPDVDLERDVIRAGTKTNEEREIPIGTAVREILLALYNRKTGSEYLFVSYRTGERFKEIKNGFRKALTPAGIKGSCLYTMRHTFGTRPGEKGYTPYEIMPLMGQRDIKTSARYVHSTDGRKREAVESIRDNSPHKIPTNGEQPTLVAASG